MYLIEKIKEKLSEKGINPQVELQGVFDIYTAPVKYIDCNLSDWSDIHGVKEVHVVIYSMKKHSLIILQTDCSYTECIHIGMTIVNNSELNSLIVGLSKSGNNMELVKKTMANFITKIVPKLIVYDVPVNDNKDIVIEKFSEERIISLIEVVLQMMKDGIEANSIIDFMCGYRGLISKHWQERNNKRINYDDLKKLLDKKTLEAIEKETEKIETEVNRELGKQD